MKYSREVKIEKEKDTARRTPADIGKNIYGKTNVNVAQGPRMGNEGHSAKRSEFRAAKAEREPLATVIEDAYAKRQHEYEDYEYTNGGSIEDNVKASFKKRK